MALSPSQPSRLKPRLAIAICAAVFIGLAVRDSSKGGIPSTAPVTSPSTSFAQSQSDATRLFVWAGYLLADPGESLPAIGVLEIRPATTNHDPSAPELLRLWSFCGVPSADGEGAVLAGDRCVLFNEGKPDSYFEFDGLRLEAIEPLGFASRMSRLEFAVAFDDDPTDDLVFVGLGYSVDSEISFFRELLARPPDDQVPPFVLSLEGLSLVPTSSSPSAWLLEIVADILFI
jgi:hypothetical protein